MHASDGDASGGPSATARAALLCVGAAIGLPIVGWLALAASTLASSIPDATVWGALVAAVLGAIAALLELGALGLAIADLLAAGRAVPPRSRFPGGVALALALAAPLTWAGEWALAAYWLLESMPSHIL